MDEIKQQIILDLSELNLRQLRLVAAFVGGLKK